MNSDRRRREIASIGGRHAAIDTLTYLLAPNTYLAVSVALRLANTPWPPSSAASVGPVLAITCQCANTSDGPTAAVALNLAITENIYDMISLVYASHEMILIV